MGLENCLGAKVLKKNRNQTFSFTNHRLLILLNMSGIIPLKLPSPRATVPSSTSAICHAFLFILLHMQRNSFSSSCSAQNIVSDFVRFWLELAIHLLALMAVQGIVRHLLSVLHQHQIMWKGPWTPICSGPVVHLGSNWFTQVPSLPVGSKDSSRP